MLYPIQCFKRYFGKGIKYPVKHYTEERVEVEFRPDHVAVRQCRDSGVVDSRTDVKRLNHLFHKRHLLLNGVKVNFGAGSRIYFFCLSW